MADRKYSLEDILSEYSEEKSKGTKPSETPSGKFEMQRVLSSKAPLSREKKTAKTEDEKPVPFRRAEEQSKINRIKREVRSGRPDIEDSRAAVFHTLELMREKVSFVNSAAADPRTAPAPKNDRIDGYEGAVVVEDPVKQEDSGDTTTIKGGYEPKIRAMEDSTRAKEKKEFSFPGRRKHKDPENHYEYKKETVVQEKKESPVSEVKTEDESKPFFFDIHHAESAKKSGAEARAERERRRRVAAIRRLRKKRMKMRENEKSDDENSRTIHIPNNDSEIRANINILRKTVSFRTAVLGLLTVLSVIFCFIESSESAFKAFASVIGYSGMSIANMLIGMAAILIAFPTVANGLRYLFVNRADSDSMAALPIAAATLGAMISAVTSEGVETGEVHLFVPVAVFILFMNALGKQLIIQRAVRNFSVISGKYEQYVLTYVDDDSEAESLTRGVQPDYPILVSMRKARQMSDFLRYTYSEDMGDRFCRRAVPVISGLSLIIAAAITGIRWTVMPGSIIPGFFLSVFSMLLCGGCCAGVMLAANIPLGNTAKKLAQKGCALLGYQSVDEFYDTNSIMMNAASVFPEGSVTIEGMKPYRDARVEDIILMAAGLTGQAGSVMHSAFLRMIDSESRSIPVIDSVMYEEDYGLSGWLKNRRILLGSREMMIQHNIEGIPSPMREAEYSQEGCEVLYFSVSGMVSAMILVKTGASSRIRHQLNKLVEERIVLVVKSVDSFITSQRIAALYQIPESFIKAVPVAQHELFDKYTGEAENVSASVIASGNAADTVRLIVSARRIRRSAMTGVILQSVAAIIGFAIALSYVALSAYTSVTAGMFLMFQLAASAVTAIAVKLK